MRYGLRFRSTAVGVAVFIVMSFAAFLLLRHFSIDIARNLGSEYARENAMRYAEKIKGTLDFDLTLTRKISENPRISEWAEAENNPQLKRDVFALLDDYLEVSRAGSWFVAFEKSGNYYFNDANKTYAGAEYIKTLSPRNVNDQWFYHTLSSPEPYNLNIDYDEVLGMTKLWLNIPILKNGKRIGVMGVGFDYTRFVDEYIAEEKKGFTTMILNTQGAIVAHKEKKYVNYRADVMDPTSWITLVSLADKGHNEDELLGHLKDLSTQKRDAVSFDLYIGGHHFIATATYLPDLRWINLSMVDLDNVFGMKEMAIIIVIFVLLIFLSWSIVYWLSERYLIGPIQAISEMTNRIKEGDYSTSPNCDFARSDEIGQLCRDINEMAIQIGESSMYAEEKYRWLADNTSDVIWVMELDGSFDYISPSVERVRGYTAEEVIKQKISEAICPGSLGAVQKSMAEAFAEVASGHIPTTKTLMIEQPCKNGSTVWTEANARLVLDEKGKPFRFIGTTRDATDRIKAEEEIRRLAFYDALTALPNRRLLLDRLDVAILLAQRTGSVGGLIYLDLDQFKPLNDQYGHEAGDELLIEVGQRIKGCLRASDTASRFGGDEFVILIHDLGTDADKGLEYTKRIAEKIEALISQPYELHATNYKLSASVGVSVFGKETSTTNEALSIVDQLMYEAKKERQSETHND